MPVSIAGKRVPSDINSIEINANLRRMEFDELQKNRFARSEDRLRLPGDVPSDERRSLSVVRGCFLQVDTKAQLDRRDYGRKRVRSGAEPKDRLAKFGGIPSGDRSAGCNPTGDVLRASKST